MPGSGEEGKARVSHPGSWGKDGEDSKLAARASEKAAGQASPVPQADRRLQRGRTVASVLKPRRLKNKTEQMREAGGKSREKGRAVDTDRLHARLV